MWKVQGGPECLVWLPATSEQALRRGQSQLQACASLVPQVFSKAELELLARLCQEHDVLCISDEVYQWLVYDAHQHISIGELSRPAPSLDTVTRC